MDAELERLVREAMDRYHVPGVAVGLLRDDREELTAFGVTSVEHPLPVDADTLFQIASITKTMTATVLMRLVDRGDLDLEAPVRRYVPRFRMPDPDAEGATLRQLVTHAAGWLGDCFADFGNGDDALERYVEAMAGLEQLTPVGGTWHYSNSSFALLGRVIEVVTDATYEQAMRDLLLCPLGMDRTYFSASEAITRRFAVGHVIVGDDAVVARPWSFPRAITPVGGIASTVRDLLRYARFHLGDGRAPDGTRLLSEGALALMRTPLARADLDRRVGVSWFLRDVGGVRFQYHTGVAIGQQGVLMLAPGRGQALAVQTNSARGALLHQEVTRWWQERSLGVRAPDPVYEDVALSRLERYPGRYLAELADVRIELTGGGLMYHTCSHNRLGIQPRPPDPSPSRVAFTGEDRFTLLDGPLMDTRGEFLRDDDGRLRWLRVGGRLYRRVPSDRPD